MKFFQAEIAVQLEAEFARLRAEMDAAFDPRSVEVLLSKVRRFKLGIRDWEAVIERGLLGKDAAALYGMLPVSDQALTRERYLQMVEAVAPELRQRYFKVYTSY